MPATVLSDLADGVRTVTLNRPARLNAINHDLIADLGAALREAEADPETRVIVLRGAGRAFCAGDDLSEAEAQTGPEPEVRAMIERLQDITRLMVYGEKPVVGAIHGWAVGGGLEWVIDCDLAVMAEGTRCFFPEISLGLFVTGGSTALLPRLVGLPRAKALIWFGERFDAATALDCGIAWKVVPDEAVFDEAAAVARRIAALPAMQARDVKKVLNRAAMLDVEAAMTLETDATARGFLDPDSPARMKAALAGDCRPREEPGDCRPREEPGD